MTSPSNCYFVITCKKHITIIYKGITTYTYIIRSIEPVPDMDTNILTVVREGLLWLKKEKEYFFKKVHKSNTY